jgi:hypothetical protein
VLFPGIELIGQMIFHVPVFLKFSGKKKDQLIDGSRAGILPGEKKDSGFDRVI